MVIRNFISLTICLSVLFSCTSHRNDIGTPVNPLILEILTPVFISDSIKHIENIAKFIEKESGLKTAIYAPKKSIEYIQALSLSSRKADVAFLNDIGYLFANDEYGAMAELIVLRNQPNSQDSVTYCPAMISINLSSFNELQGKTIAFSDEYSTAGFLIPLYNLKEKGIKPSKTVFAGGYINALRILLAGQVDASVIYTSCNTMSNELDSRNLIIKESPDIFERTRIIFKAQPIPNEPVVFRKNLPDAIKNRVKNAIIKCPEDQVCREALLRINKVTGFKKTDGSEYKVLKTIISKIEKDIPDLIPGGWILRIRNSPELPRTGN